MKCIGVLSQITIYTNFKWAVLNIKDIVRNQNPSSKKLGSYQKHRHFSSNTKQAQPLKRPFLKRFLEKLKLKILNNGKEF